MIGDFSFARSLTVKHRCRNVLATCYDSKDELCRKYPQVEGNIQAIHDAFLKKDKKRKTEEGEPTSDHDGRPGISDEKDQNGEKDDGKEEAQGQNDKNKRQSPKVLFSVDARKLGHASVGGGRDVRNGFPRLERRRPAWLEYRHAANKKHASSGKKGDVDKGGPWDIICFNFPHVGGLSTDVNRQVRFNQELLVAFFKACVPLLSRPVDINDEDEDEDEDYEWGESSDDDSGEDEDEDDSGKRTKSMPRTEPGQILVTLFEGEPYTLWNIKDLARHAGLKVVTSFRFPWASYQGYSHARTLGHIEWNHGGRGGWKGEDRNARMYVFEVKQNDHATPQSSKADTGKKKKRSRNGSDSDDSD